MNDQHVVAIASCADCEESYCEKHKEQHAKRKATSTHNVIAIEGDAIEFERKPVRALCTIHAFKELEGFCDTCTTVICVSCMLHSHKGHKYRSLDEVRLEKITMLQEMQVVLAKQLRSLATGISKVERCETASAESLIAAIASVEEHVRGVQAAAAAAGALIVDELKTMSAQKGKQKLGAQLLNLEFAQCDAENVHCVITKALACRDIPSMLVLYSSILPRVASLELSEPSWQLQPCTNGEVFFKSAAIAVNLGGVVDGDHHVAAGFKMEVTGDNQQRTVTIVALSAIGHDVPPQLITVQLQPPTGAAHELVVTAMGQGQFAAPCRLAEDGEHVISVMLRDKQVMGSPQRVVYHAVQAAAYQAEVTGVAEHRTITIVAKNKSGRLVHDGEGFKVRLQGPTGAGPARWGVVLDKGEGGYSVTCVLAAPGKYAVSVMLRNEHVDGSPLRMVWDASWSWDAELVSTVTPFSPIIPLPLHTRLTPSSFAFPSDNPPPICRLITRPSPLSP